MVNNKTKGRIKMLEQLNKKAIFRFVSLVVIGTFIFSNIASANIISSSEIRKNAVKKTDTTLKIGTDLSNFDGAVISGDVLTLERKSSLFRNGVEPVNPRAVIEDVDVETSVMTAANLVQEGLRGAALGLDPKKDKEKITGIKNAADGTAKGIYQRIIQDSNLILVVRVSEGMGRDEVTESFMANEVVVPNALLGELKDIGKAIEAGSTQYTSKTGKVYTIKNAIIDVIEGTNAFVSNVGGKELKDLKNSESGATSVIVMSDGILLGNCPDIYADGIFTLVPKDKRQGFIDEPLDPELTASDPGKIESVLKRIAEANGIGIGDLAVVLMDRPREAQRLAALKELQNKYPGLEITTILDGTVAPSLLSTFGRKEGKHKIVMTVGGAPEVFLNTVVASVFKSEGALASIRIYSKNVNKTADGKEAQDLNRRYAFDSNERKELNNLRPADAEAIFSGSKLFTQEDVRGDVEGSFSFITNNGVFNIQGAERVAEDKIKVNLMRIGKINGQPAAWISEKIIDTTKDIMQNFITSIADDQPLLNFASTEAVMEALKGIVEVAPTGVKIVDEGRLREYLIDQLVYDATFNPDKNVVDLCRKLIRDIAMSEGVTSDSVYNLYVQKAHDPRQWTVPAINIRGMGYNTARAVFTSAVANNVGPFILEIAKSEIGYTSQRPAEFTTSILAAAIKEGYRGPVYLQGDHFQITAKDYAGNPEKARGDIKKLIREAIEGGFYQIDLDMSVLVDWSKPTADEQQRNNYTETALLTAYVRGLEKELGLDKKGIVVNLGGEIGEIGMGLEKGKERNSTVEDLRAFMNGYLAELKRLSQELGYELKPITKVAVQTGTKHGGVRDAQGKITQAKVSFNTLAELGRAVREYGMAGVVQHGASTLPEAYFTVFAGKQVPEGMTIDESLLNEASKTVLGSNPVAEVHLATAYQDTTMDHQEFPQSLLEQIKSFILLKNPPKEGQDPNKVFVDNRKNAWGPFKVQVWNLPANIQKAIRDSLGKQFDTVFKNLGVTVVRDTYIQAVDATVYKTTSVRYSNFISTIKEYKETNKGAVVMGANAIFENGGSVTALNELKQTGVYKVVVWAQDEKAVETLKVMGIGETDIKYTKDLNDVLTNLEKTGIAYQKITLVVSPLDRVNINLDKIQSLGVKVRNLQTPKAKEDAKINSMPLVIAQAIASIADDDYITNKFEELSQVYSESGQISSADLKNLNALTSIVFDMPLVQLTKEEDKEALQAQITYAETVSKI
jgi:fructose-1,6-bisphosphatase/sedoheptulose 1,7-bisphosphatase-like protein